MESEEKVVVRKEKLGDILKKYVKWFVIVLACIIVGSFFFGFFMEMSGKRPPVIDVRPNNPTSVVEETEFTIDPDSEPFEQGKQVAELIKDYSDEEQENFWRGFNSGINAQKEN